MKKSAFHSPESRRGQVLIIVALGLTVLLVIAGLVLDYGVWQVQQRGMRNAADGAAQAGVSELMQKPITPQKQLNAATHAMEYLNSQLSLGLAPADIGTAASHALNDQNGFGAEDAVAGYSGQDHFRINTPVTPAVSCTGQSWGPRAITVHIDHFAPRFMSKLFFSGDQPVNACATASLGGNGYAIAVLKPNSGTQPNSANITMKLGGSDTFVRVCGGDVANNATFGGGPQPPPNSTQQPAYLKFMKSNSVPACDIDNDNKMLLTIDNPSPMSWSDTSKQIRIEGATAAEADDAYQPPVHLPSYVQIPSWGQAQYALLNDAALPTKHLRESDPGGGISCTPPAGYDPLDPGKYNLVATGSGNGQIALRWLCPGVYHFVPINGQQGIQLGSNTTLAGQGVTLVFETGPNHNQDDSVVSVQSGSNLLLNSSASGLGTETPAPWMTGDSVHNVPITIWIKPTCTGAPVLTCSSSSVFNMGSGSGLEIKGMIFGPTDNMKIAGNGSHHGAGEIWAWTLEYVGNSQLDQVYSGSDEGYPTLVE